MRLLLGGGRRILLRLNNSSFRFRKESKEFVTASVRGAVIHLEALVTCETRFAQTFSVIHGPEADYSPELADVTGELIFMTQ